MTIGTTSITQRVHDNVAICTAAVPEPASWATMIGGLGVVRVALRRRRSPIDMRRTAA